MTTMTRTSYADRWRMTLDEICYFADTSPQELEQWCQLGAFGPRWRESRDRGKWHHISRLVAQRAVIMRALVNSGLMPSVAAAAASTHERGAVSDLIVAYRGVTITVKRSELDLP